MLTQLSSVKILNTMGRNSYKDVGRNLSCAYSTKVAIHNTSKNILTSLTDCVNHIQDEELKVYVMVETEVDCLLWLTKIYFTFCDTYGNRLNVLVDLTKSLEYELLTSWLSGNPNILRSYERYWIRCIKRVCKEINVNLLGGWETINKND